MALPMLMLKDRHGSLYASLAPILTIWSPPPTAHLIHGQCMSHSGHKQQTDTNSKPVKINVFFSQTATSSIRAAQDSLTTIMSKLPHRIRALRCNQNVTTIIFTLQVHKQCKSFSSRILLDANLFIATRHELIHSYVPFCSRCSPVILAIDL
jgi:hypothetical protein